ncbi:Mitochondrial distribution and morphology protein 12 [Geranomyces variabilis]|nr:Mitochondrial distribution and morphology protein 12 [Geranomyces variabilis]
MSFLINWDLLADGAEADGLREFLNARFSTITRPSFLGPLKVTELDFGDVPPEVAVTDICDPAAEFYLPDDPEIWRPSTPPAAPSVAGIDLEEVSGSATLVQHDENADFADPSWSGWRDAHDGERDDESESYFIRSHHPSAAMARGELLRRRGRPPASDAYHDEYDAEERDFAALARGRNVSSDNFRALEQGGRSDDGRQRRDHDFTIPRPPSLPQQPRSTAASRQYTHNNSRSPAPSSPGFVRPGAYTYGTGWSGSVGLGLGLGIGTRTASNHSYPLTHPRPVFTSAPPSLAPSMIYARSDRSSGYPDDLIEEDEEGPPGSTTESLRLPRRSDHEIAAEYAATMRRASDAQVEFEIVYKGNMRLAIQTELIVNQPTPAFMVLPLLLTLTGFQFTASALISYLGDRINFCFKESDAGTTILQDVSIDSEVGDGRKQGVLKNVGRIERFIVEQLRKVIQDFMVFPNHHSLKLLQDPVRNNKSDENIFGDGGSEDFDDGMSYDPPI